MDVVNTAANTEPRAAPDAVPAFRVLGVRVDAVGIPEAVARMERWVAERNGCRYVTVTGMHGTAEARRDPAFREILNAAAMVVPDGMPLVWLGRLRGHRLRRRVYGPELMLEFCRATAAHRLRHYFYGGASGVAEALAAKLAEQFPGLVVAGTYTPPFRPLTAEEGVEIVERINQVAPDVLWVGLSTPKQERWMAEHRERLRVPVMVGVGAAFDIHTGRLRQAPRWMRENGLEWFYRLAQEPRRLWRRYILLGSYFVWNVGLEVLGLRRFD